MYSTRCVVAGVALTVAASGAAFADTVEMVRIGEGKGRVLTLSGSAVGGNFYTFSIGELTYEFRNGTGEASVLNGVIQTFCADLAQDSSFEWEQYNIVPLEDAPDPGPAMGASRAQAIANIFAGANGQQHATPDYAAAFQMMVWKIIYDYDGTEASVDVNTGTVNFSSSANYFAGVMDKYNELRGFLGTAAPIGGLRGASNPNFQDQLVVVPSPGSLALVGAALGLAAVRRRSPRR
ncbi:MAG: hypothetical protein KF745_09445 [Phycisphaeraceae bacterium]|nr:hypothetical protein [Phycisphaeraceae bacterium]